MIGYLALVPLGFAVGVLGTLIGAGGGFILMPVLLVCYPDRPPEELAAVSLAVVFVNAGSGSVSYGLMRCIDYRSGICFLMAGLPGAALGAVAVAHVPRDIFSMVFGVLLAAVGGALFVRPETRAEPGCSRAAQDPAGFGDMRHHRSPNLALGTALSSVIGFVSSLLGIGGGIIHVPAMVRLLGFPVHMATATSHFVLAGVAAAGTAVHAVQGALDGSFGRVAALAVGALAGAPLGARLSARVRGRWIMKCLGLALALAGGRILISALWL